MDSGASRGGPSAALRRLAADQHAAAVAGALLAVAALAQALAQLPSGPASTGALQVAFVVMTLCTVLPAWLLGGYPAAAAVVVCAASVLSLLAFHTLTIAGLLAALVLMYRLGRGGSQLLAASLGLVFMCLALLFVARQSGHSAGPAVLAMLLAALGLTSAWGGATRRARAEAAEYTSAREVIAGTLLEHTARGERARVSRELHDVVAHHISMISVLAETARLTTPGMPAAGAQRLSAIGDTARAALTEMRRLLGVLREDTRADGPARQPQPGLAQLNELIDAARDTSGSGVRLIVRGQMTALDPGVELAAYRIIQEGLTNARRHAEGAAVDVELSYTPEALRLRVRDNGPGPPPASPATSAPPGGNGLLGMRERAVAVGGELCTGAAPGGGFLVEATLPATAEAAS